MLPRTQRNLIHAICGGDSWYRDRTGRWCCGHCRDLKAQQRRNLRRVAIAAYGGECACCGESNPKFLTFDHIDNDGAKQRRISGRGKNSFIHWLKDHDWPKSIQLLCWNCNCGRANNGGICPHEEEADRGELRRAS